MLVVDFWPLYYEEKKTYLRKGFESLFANFVAGLEDPR